MRKKQYPFLCPQTKASVHYFIHYWSFAKQSIRSGMPTPNIWSTGPNMALNFQQRKMRLPKLKNCLNNHAGVPTTQRRFIWDGSRVVKWSIYRPCAGETTVHPPIRSHPQRHLKISCTSTAGQCNVPQKFY